MAPIVLTGFSGSGKSTVVDVLEASTKDVKIVDTDRVLEKKFGKTIKEIFRVEGEDKFRKEESLVLEDALNSADIISVGGGCLIDESNLKKVKAKSTLIYLEVSKENLLKRLDSSQEERPLFSEKDFDVLFSERLPGYTACDVKLSNNYASAEEIAKAVELILDLNGDALEQQKLLAVPAQYHDRSNVLHIIGKGILSELSKVIELYFPKSKKVAFIADSNLSHLSKELSDSLADSVWIEVPSGENSKSFSHYQELLGSLAQSKLIRTDLVVALGGGVVGDLAGFVASSYLRGVNLIQVPSTVVAQVDSAIGGKTGINLEEGKNLVGSFYPARVVLSDTQLLSTLPEREYISGLAEVVKYAAVFSESFFEWLEENFDSVLSREQDALFRIIEESTLTKIDVVFDDLLDTKGIRAKLNFGHTFGHAIEKLTGYGSLLHGEAIAVGMKIATGFCESEGICRSGVNDRLCSLLGRLKLSVDFNDDSLKGAKDYLALREKGGSLEGILSSAKSSAGEDFAVRWAKTLMTDKKSISSDEIAFVCLEKIGSGVVKEVKLEKLLDYFAGMFRAGI